MNLSKFPAIECKDEPPSYENMEYTNGYNITKYYFGNMLKYECNEGYIFYGTNSIRCLTTGKWSKLKGKCVRMYCIQYPPPPQFFAYYIFQEFHVKNQIYNQVNQLWEPRIYTKIRWRLFAQKDPQTRNTPWGAQAPSNGFKSAIATTIYNW